MSIPQLVIALLALAVCLGLGRLLHGVQRTDRQMRPKAWRLAVLVLLQFGSATLLYFTLFPPSRLAPAQNLVVLTAQAKAADVPPGSGRIIALPEASVQAGIERVPDLASALRRYPGADSVQIIGDGLPLRDIDAARGLSVFFQPPPLPDGLTGLRWPSQVSPGMRWQLHGRVQYRQPVTLELLDPGNAVVASTTPDAQGGFSLSDDARSMGQALYRVRVLGAGKKSLETLDVPVWTAKTAPLRVLMLSGGPNPELKYIRRWASDAGIALESRIALGQGMQIQTGNAGLNAASLREQDLVILDERAWNGLGAGGRQALTEALNGGLGVLLRLTGPLGGPAAGELRALGFSVQETQAVQGVRLPEGRDKPQLPELSRRPLRVQSPDGVVMLRTDKNEPLAVWRAQGQGRIGLWWLTDTYKLALSGATSRHGQLWAEAAATVARARDNPILQSRQQHIWVDQRAVFCGLSDDAAVQEPDGRISRLLIGSKGANTGCAAYWPRLPGWHAVNSKTAALPFYVRAAGEMTGLKANALREGTLALVGGRALAGTTAKVPVPGPHWPYFLAWLLVTALLWALERSRLGCRK
ncbi:MAG TPA: hypothetical protein VN248_05275 [Arenimonas sp.]|nr:hypothetical protein [Arenimonas sp.]